MAVNKKLTYEERVNILVVLTNYSYMFYRQTKTTNL